jgi:type IV pilus assembly protein PilZ
MSQKSKTSPKQKSAPATKKMSEQDAKKEARANQRIPIQLLVDYRCNGHYLFDFCRDLGTGGVFIETDTPLVHGSTVDLTFTLPDSKETLQTKGKVIWVQSSVPNKKLTPGMGVQFEAFDKKQREILERFVKRYHSEGLNNKKLDRSAS